MRTPFRRPAHALLERLTLGVLAIVLLIRFPLNFAFENAFLMDFQVYYLTAQRIVAGHAHLLYDLVYSDDMYFKYAPVWAALWSPLGLLSAHAGAVVWSAVNVAWLVVSLSLCGRLMREASLPYPAWTAATVALLSARLLTNLFSNGQTDLWWTGLTLLFLLAETRERGWLAGLMLALSISLKLPSALVWLYLAATRRWRTAGTTLVCFAALLTAGGLALDPAHPWMPTASWIRRLTLMAPESLFMIGDQSLAALCARFLSPDGYGLNIATLPRPALLAAAMGLSLALFAAIILPLPGPNASPRRLLYDAAMLMLLMTLASPSAWLATYVTMMPGLFVATAGVWNMVRRRQSGLLMPASAAVVTTLSFATHRKFWRLIHVPDWRTESYVFLVFMVVPLMALAVFAALWIQRRRLAAAPPDTSRS